MTAIPCGQKKRRRETIQSQTVTPPLAAMEGTTFKLKTATTKSRTRSKRPRTRLRWGASEWVVEVKAVAREPGDRAKVAVYSTNANVDPVGACIGLRGVRINAISNELRGEK